MKPQTNLRKFVSTHIILTSGARKWGSEQPPKASFHQDHLDHVHSVNHVECLDSMRVLGKACFGATLHHFWPIDPSPKSCRSLFSSNAPSLLIHFGDHRNMPKSGLEQPSITFGSFGDHRNMPKSGLEQHSITFGAGLGPGPAWARAWVGPGPGLGRPGPTWARAQPGPRPSLRRKRKEERIKRTE